MNTLEAPVRSSLVWPALLLLLACGSKNEAPTPAAPQQDVTSKGGVVDSGAGETGTDSVSVDDGKNQDSGPAGAPHQDVAPVDVDVLGDAGAVVSSDVAISPDTLSSSPNDAEPTTGTPVDVVSTDAGAVAVASDAGAAADVEQQGPVDTSMTDTGAVVDTLDSATTAGSDAQGSLDSGSASGAFQWYKTCGSPVCKGWSAKPGIPMCVGQKPGISCTKKADKCDPKDFCDALLLCTDVDPTKVGCGKSSRRFKRQIRYLDAAQRQELAAWLFAQRLATWKYRDGDDRLRLGFVVEDQPRSPAIDARGDRVDVYSYASMLAAALQTQAARIEQLERRLKAIQRKDPGRRESGR